MAGRNTRVQTEITYARPPHGGLFFIQNIFIQNVTFRRSHSPITASASKRHEHKPQSEKRLHNAGESESEKPAQRYARDVKPRGKALSKYA